MSDFIKTSETIIFIPFIIIGFISAMVYNNIKAGVHLYAHWCSSGGVG